MGNACLGTPTNYQIHNKKEKRLEWQKGARSYVVAVMGFNLRHRLMDYVLMLHCIHTVVNTNAIEGEDC